MRYLLFILLILLCIFLQGRISILGISPDLTAILAFYAGIRYGETKGLLFGVLLGTLEDSVSSSIIGPNMLSKGIIGFSSSFFVSGGFLRWTPFLGMIALILLTFADSIVVFMSRSLFDRTPAALSTVLLISTLRAILNSPAGIFIRPKHVE